MAESPDSPLLGRIATVDVQPVFILGLHRSGTTILYELLAAAGPFNVVTAYHLIRYDELLSLRERGLEGAAREELNARFAAGGRADRGIDRVGATADSLEEYGFLLLEKSGRRGLSEQNLPVFRELCQKVAHLAGNDRSLLVKNPYDLPAFPLIHRAFPEARFVFIHRHPLRTLTSSLRALRSLLAGYNAYTAELSTQYRELFDQPAALGLARLLLHERHPTGAVLLALGAVLVLRHYLKHLDRIPRDRVVELRYEDLCQDPTRTVHGVLQGLGLELRDSSSLDPRLAPRQVPLDPGVARCGGVLRTLLKPYYERFGYGVDPERWEGRQRPATSGSVGDVAGGAGLRGFQAEKL